MPPPRRKNPFIQRHDISRGPALNRRLYLGFSRTTGEHREILGLAICLGSWRKIFLFEPLMERYIRRHRPRWVDKRLT